MYIYNKPATAPRMVLSGLSGLGEDRYIPAKNVDPVTGQPTISAKYPAPWAVADVSLRNIRCRFYHNAPRELVLTGSMPYTMEIGVPGHRFVGSCHPREECPEEVYQGADPKDPWRIRRCKEWRDQWNQEAANIIADPEFRANITERVLDVAGIQGASRLLTDQAEFLEVVQEREARERPIKMIAFIFLAGAGGILTFNAVRKYVKKRAARKEAKKAEEAAEQEASSLASNPDSKNRRHFVVKYRPGYERILTSGPCDEAEEEERRRRFNPFITEEECEERGGTWVESFVARRGGKRVVVPAHCRKSTKGIRRASSRRRRKS